LKFGENFAENNFDVWAEIVFEITGDWIGDFF
jgi:hypothetical protein